MLFSLIGGLLPDIDSSTSRSKTIIFTILGIAFSFMFFEYELTTGPATYYSLIYTASCYIFTRYILSSLMKRYVVHRGIFHSLPVMFCWAFGIADTISYFSLTYKLSEWMIAISIASGFLSHLILDEVYSVNLENLKIKKSFGSALKFASANNIPTFSSYVLMIMLYSGMPNINDFTSNYQNINLVINQAQHLVSSIKNVTKETLKNTLGYRASQSTFSPKVLDKFGKDVGG